MSGGQHDMRAVGEIGSAVEDAAYELRDAIKKAVEGHRGFSVNVESIVNEILGEACPYELRRKPQRWGE